MEVKHWTHPANFVKITEGQVDSKRTIHVYTDGSKCEYGVESGIAIFSDSNIIDTIKYRLNERCSNNQAEQLAILNALEKLQHLETNERTVTVLTDSRVALESLKTGRNTHTLLKNQPESDRIGEE
jgi:ribonuclease HI